MSRLSETDHTEHPLGNLIYYGKGITAFFLPDNPIKHEVAMCTTTFKALSNANDAICTSLIIDTLCAYALVF